MKGSDDYEEKQEGSIASGPASGKLPLKEESTSRWARILQKGTGYGVLLESHGIVPITVEERTETRFFQNFTLWPPPTTPKAARRDREAIADFPASAQVDDEHNHQCFLSWNSWTTVLRPFTTSESGFILMCCGLQIDFQSPFQDSALIIVFSNIFSCAFPAYFGLWGPRLGLRMMTNARYSYGYYGAMLPTFFNLATFLGFCAINSIVGGQALSAVNPGHLSVSVGIVLIAVLSLVVSFCGYRVLHTLERWAWIPLVFSFVMLAGFGGRHLGSALAFEASPATAGSVLTFISIILGFTISYCGMTADMNTYMRPDVASSKVFFLTFAGIYLPCMLIQVLGAAFGCAALSGQVTTWGDAFGEGAIGPLIAVALEPLQGFGKVIVVILALGIITNNAPTVYSYAFQTLTPVKCTTDERTHRSFSMSAQTFLPILIRVPRYLLPVVATAIYLPIGLVGATHFFAALSSFLGLIGYWASIFTTIFILEHLVFRRANFTNYDVSHWNEPGLLPVGIAAVFSSIVGAALAVLSMDQVWFRGPIARAIAGSATSGGDVGIELGMAASGVSYLITRTIEKRMFGR
ncbi:hypothetical protein P7C70_g7995, partial [Phenoliferia sp. Uapishka_3]